MGVRRSSTGGIGNADNFPRKMDAFVRRSRGPGGGFRTLELKTSKDDKDGKKIRVAIGKSRGHTDGVRILEPKKRLNKKGISRGNSVDSVSHVGVTEKSGKLRTRAEKDLRTKNGNIGFESRNNVDSSRKRKRVYADPAVVESRSSEGNVKKIDRKSNSRDKKEIARVHLDKGKKVMRGKAKEFEDFPKKKLVTGRKRIKNELLDSENDRGMFRSAEKLKHALANDLRDETAKRSGKQKAHFAAKLNLDRRKYGVDSVGKPSKNKVQGKKSLITDSESMEDRPKKKKKRVIRIDPHDVSNKRLDDDISGDGNSHGKKDLAETNDVEMSKNAQFRAICPSPSILSFVEDNLLGRRRDIEFRRAGYNTELSAPLDNIPFSTSPERERIEIPVFRNKLEFFAAARVSSSFPSPELQEIAFAGRSNVGKSSLLNALTRQWGVVRTSDKPGLTQTINFFKLGSKLCLVDLPGYGFAYAKEEVKEAWEELVKEYVSSRVGLKRVCLLVDTKWGMKPRDHELIDLMERSQTKYQIVLTKTDLVFPMDVARRAMQIEEQLKAKKSAVQPLMMISSKTGAGIRSLRTVLANVARFVRR